MSLIIFKHALAWMPAGGVWMRRRRRRGGVRLGVYFVELLYKRRCIYLRQWINPVFVITANLAVLQQTIKQTTNVI